MKRFKLDTDVINTVIKELRIAKKFIYIAIFQLHRLDIFRILMKKLEEGIDLEIFTLPYDSINVENRKEIIQRFESLQDNGAIIHFCKWNVGNPSRTTTAVGKWYSFHGKFIVTDRSTIAMSANFTEKDELDAVLIFRDEKNKIEEFKGKFEKLKKLFINKYGEYDGNIREKILETNIDGINSTFNLPGHIRSKIHKVHWIRDYPDQIFSNNPEIQEKLYIIPFDGKGRDLFRKIILRAEKFVYLSTETFTDPEFPFFLEQIALKGIEIKILTSVKTMDFRDRVQKMFRELLSQHIRINTVSEELHAKLIITDKELVLSSINLNKISLGFQKKTGLWRENTEVLYIYQDDEILDTAIKEYRKVFNSGRNVKYKLSNKLGEELSKKIRTIFNIYSVSKDVKHLLGNFVLEREILLKSNLNELSQKVSEVTKHFDKSMINLDYFGMGYLLYLISKNINYFKDIIVKFNELDLEFDVKENLDILLKEGMIEKKENRYIIPKR